MVPKKIIFLDNFFEYQNNPTDRGIIISKYSANIFGFPKMVRKGDMNQQMLDVRTSVLDDYIKLFDIYQDNSQVKSGLELKYKQLQLETINK